MSVIRTSLSLIGLGFTIFQFFQKMRDANVISRANAPRNFGITLVAIGIGMLVPEHEYLSSAVRLPQPGDSWRR